MDALLIIIAAIYLAFGAFALETHNQTVLDFGLMVYTLALFLVFILGCCEPYIAYAYVRVKAVLMDWPI